MKRTIVKIDEEKCDGCGLCVPTCAEGALRIVDGKARLVSERHCDGLGACLGHCPRGAISIEEREAEPFEEEVARTPRSELAHWPVQLRLVSAEASFLQGADLLVAADCVPFAYADFHRHFLRHRAVVVGCPKLDEPQGHLAKLAQIITVAQPRRITVVRMEVPCCYGLVYLTRQALAQAGRDIPLEDAIISITGERKGTAAVPASSPPG